MRSWVVNEFGDPSNVLQLLEVPEPIVGAGEVLIEVEAAALNFFDILLCQGKHQNKPTLPFTPGSEISGTIRAVGEGSSFKMGQRVLAKPKLPSGGLAKWITVQDEKVFRIPDTMPFEEAAAFFTTYQTSYYALHRRGNLKAGEVLLVHAGAGGVGSSAIQLGKIAGAYVIATAGGPEKTRICEELGADLAIDYLTDDFVKIVNDVTGGRGADVVYDPVGGDVFDRSRKCIAFEGRILLIGFTSGRIADLPTNHPLVKNYSVVGASYGLFRILYPEKMKGDYEKVLQLYEQGDLSPLIYKQKFQFEEVPQALDLLGGRKTWGKLIVTL